MSKTADIRDGALLYADAIRAHLVSIHTPNASMDGADGMAAMKAIHDHLEAVYVELWTFKNTNEQ